MKRTIDKPAIFCIFALIFLAAVHFSAAADAKEIPIPEISGIWKLDMYAFMPEDDITRIPFGYMEMTVRQRGEKAEITLGGKTIEKNLILEKNNRGKKYYSWESEKDGIYFGIKNDFMMIGSIKGRAFIQARKIEPISGCLPDNMIISGLWKYAETSMTGRYLSKGEIYIAQDGTQVVATLGPSENSEKIAGEIIRIGQSYCLRLSSPEREFFLYLGADWEMAGYIYYASPEVAESGEARYIFYALRP